MAMTDNALKCGYLTILKNNVYDGTFVNNTDQLIYNGMIMFLDGTTLTLHESANQFMVREETEIYDNVPAYRVLVKKLDELCYFIENNWDFNDSEAYDTRKYAVEKDAMLNAHPLEEGEEFLISATLIDGKPQLGATITVNADGSLHI